MSSHNLPSSGNIKKEKIYPVETDVVLPEGYGETEAYLLPRDPAWMFMYWEVTAATFENLKKEFGDDILFSSRSIIRLYDITDSGESDLSGASYTDINIMFDARSWYINVPAGGRCYMAELGLIDKNGRFIVIARTNVVGLPAGKVSDVIDERWMSIKGDFERLLDMSGVNRIGIGSGEVTKMMAQRWEMYKSMFSGSSSALPLKTEESKEKDFWLVADCELILYGATEPTAKVTVAGRNVQLNPDGTFSLRFSFPDGKLSLPVFAVNKDGDMTREIKIDAERWTTK